MPRAPRTAAAPITPAADFDSLVSSVAVPAATSSARASADPTITLEGEVNAALLAFMSHKAAMKNSETSMRTEEAKILGFAMPKIDSLNLNKDNPPTSWVIAGTKAATESNPATKVSVKLIMSDKFSVSQDAPVLAALKTTLGDDYNEAVQENTDVSIKPEVFESAELKAEFMALIQSADNFRKFFTVEKKTVAKKGFLDRIWKLAKTPEKLAAIRGFMVPAKAALK